MSEQTTRLIEAADELEPRFRMGEESEVALRGDGLVGAELVAWWPEWLLGLERDIEALVRKISEE